MEPLILSAIYLVPPLLLILLGLVAGTVTERSHLRRLARREAALGQMLVTDLRGYEPAVDQRSPPVLVMAEAVISTDYLKSFLARLRNIFGGEVRSFLTLVQRARREALVRLMEEAQQKGYTALCNVRLETADIGQATNPRRGVTLAAVLASATAYRRAAAEHPYREPPGADRF